MKVQFFSQLKDLTGTSELTLDLPERTTVADLLARLYRDFPALEKWDRHILIGADLEFVARDYPIQPNDHISIMPPVQGG